MSFRAVPLTQRQANAFIKAHHRHHAPSVGDRFRVGVELDGRLVGVAVVGRPVARRLDNGTTVEVTRLCTDGTPNACSFLYSRCARIAREFGYARIVTYILGKEPGTSLMASGWVKDREVPGQEWTRPSRPRQTSAPACDKQRWVKVLSDNPAPVDFPKERRGGKGMSPCPCCACPDVYLAETDGGGLTVACPRCGMSGPESVDGDVREAKNGWEFLHGKMCRKCSRHLLRRIRELKAEIATLNQKLGEQA